jgi:hypothetical protein
MEIGHIPKQFLTCKPRGRSMGRSAGYYVRWIDILFKRMEREEKQKEKNWKETEGKNYQHPQLQNLYSAVITASKNC